MAKFIIRRVLWVFPVLLAILVIVFLLMHAIPGGPFDPQGGRRALPNRSMDETTKAALLRRYGLDDPLWKQFVTTLIGRVDHTGTFICGLVCGNMGPSYRQYGRTVQDILFEAPKGKTFFQSRFAYSFRLAVYAFLFSVIVGIPMGVLAAVQQATWVDLAIKSLATLFIAVPNFVAGLVIIIVLGGQLHLIKIAPTNWEAFDPRVWFAPLVILSMGTLASFIRLTRASLLEVLGRDFVRTAHAKGASLRRVIWGHVIKNAMIPIVSFSGPALLELFAGSFVIETMFGYPGMGRQFIDAVQRLDYSVVMGVTLVYALLAAGVNLLVDIGYAVVDPRIRLH